MAIIIIINIKLMMLDMDDAVQNIAVGKLITVI